MYQQFVFLHEKLNSAFDAENPGRREITLERSFNTFSQNLWHNKYKKYLFGDIGDAVTEEETELIRIP